MEFRYDVAYRAGAFSGERTVYAEDEEQAIAKVKTWVSRMMVIPVHSESYRIIKDESDQKNFPNEDDQ